MLSLKSFIWFQSFLKKLISFTFNPLTTIFSQLLETSQLIHNANQLAGFYMMGKTDR